MIDTTEYPHQLNQGSSERLKRIKVAKRLKNENKQKSKHSQNYFFKIARKSIGSKATFTKITENNKLVYVIAGAFSYDINSIVNGVEINVMEWRGRDNSNPAIPYSIINGLNEAGKKITNPNIECIVEKNIITAIANKDLTKEEITSFAENIITSIRDEYIKHVS